MHNIQHITEHLRNAFSKLVLKTSNSKCLYSCFSVVMTILIIQSMTMLEMDEDGDEDQNSSSTHFNEDFVAD